MCANQKGNGRSSYKKFTHIRFLIAGSRGSVNYPGPRRWKSRRETNWQYDKIENARVYKEKPEEDIKILNIEIM